MLLRKLVLRDRRLQPPTRDEHPKANGKLQQSLRGYEGARLMLEEKLFFEKVLTSGAMRDMDDTVMA